MNTNENKIVRLSIALVVFFAIIIVIVSNSQIPMTIHQADSGLYVNIGAIIVMTVVFTVAIGGVLLGIVYYSKQNH
jgi:hypothetical protein